MSAFPFRKRCGSFHWPNPLTHFQAKYFPMARRVLHRRLETNVTCVIVTLVYNYQVIPRQVHTHFLNGYFQFPYASGYNKCRSVIEPKAKRLGNFLSGPLSPSELII